jgi:hypothetical protein
MYETTLGTFYFSEPTVAGASYLDMLELYAPVAHPSAGAAVPLESEF